MKKSTLFDILSLIVITLIAYFPVSMFIYSLKNDSLLHYLPFRYHFSESVQHGYFPFWSPYLYTGFPIHAEMQGMSWNPIVLLISLFTRYNMTVLEIELMIYLVVSAIGMYLLLKSFNLSRIICILGGISYMSCGFMNGSASVIPWISSAAFIPFVFMSFKYLLERRTWKSSIFFGISLSLLFLCGYPTFFIYTCYILFVVLLLAYIGNFRKKAVQLNFRTVLHFLLPILIFLLVCSPAIVSFIEFLPYYSRGSGLSLARAGENPFTPYSSLSFLLPNAVHKDHAWLNTDTSMRNSYIGIFVFAIGVLSLLFKRTKLQNLILGITVFSFLLSLGSVTPLHKICYAILPLFDTFRHPGNIRLYTSIGIILLAALLIQRFIDGKYPKQWLFTTGWVLAGILILPVIYVGVMQPGVISNIGDAIKTGQPKAMLDELRFPSMLLIQAVMQLAFVIAMIYLVKKKNINRKAIIGVIAANSVLFCWIALPFNFISQIRTKQVNQYVASFPDGYPFPDVNTPVEANVISDSIDIPVYGYRNFYNKKITIQDHITTPSINEAYEKFIDDRKLRALFKDYPVAWLNDTIVAKVPDSIEKKFSLGCFVKKDWNDSTTGSLKLVDFRPGKFVFDVTTDQATVLSVFQQYNQNWQVTINGKNSGKLRMNTAFIGIPVPAGKSEIVLKYKPANVILAAWISLLVIILIAGYLIISSLRKKKHE